MCFWAVGVEPDSQQGEIAVEEEGDRAKVEGGR